MPICSIQVNPRIYKLEVITYCLNNNATYNTNTPSGDNRVIEYHFVIAPEGTDINPKVNKRTLNEFMHRGISGCYPKYYGLVYQSSKKGNVTLAFSSWEEAYQYAYNYENGTVESLGDGTYLYSSSFSVETKKKYNSDWELTEALYESAEQAVKELYIDPSDESTYLTISNTSLSFEDLKHQRLERSVVLFAGGQQELLTINDALPILNSRPYAYLDPVDGGGVEAGKDDFQFVNIKNDIDSKNVAITESSKTHFIKYNKSVDEQLGGFGYPTGIVKIVEENINDGYTEYEAVYFANGDNTAHVTIAYYVNGQKQTVELTQDDKDTTINADLFMIQSLTDELDPYNLVIVFKDNNPIAAFAADQPMNLAWCDQGEYQIKVVNRIGNWYSFNMIVNETDYATVSFQGQGTEGLEPIIAKKGDTHIRLPEAMHDNLEFKSYCDEEGTEYQGEIEQIDSNGSMVLKPTWSIKKCHIILKDADGRELKTIDAAYGSEIELGAPDIPEGYSFIGWLRDGSLLPDNKILVRDDEITLIASVSDNNVTTTPEMVQPGNEQKQTGLFVALGIAFLGACGGGAAVIAHKKRKSKEHAQSAQNDSSDNGETDHEYNH